MRKFYRIANIFEFVKLQLDEQYQFLVDNCVYVSGKSNNDEIKKNCDVFNLMDSYPSYIGQDFIINGASYKINDDFVDEVFGETISVFMNEVVSTIDNNLKTLKTKINFFTDSEIKDQIERLRKEEINNLDKKLFCELLEFEEEGVENKIHCVLKRHLSVNFNNLFDYIIGMGNFKGYDIYSGYYHFLRIKKHKQFYNQIQTNFNSKETPNEKGLTMSQRLLLIEGILLRKDSFNDLSNFQKAKVYSLLLGYNEDNIRKKLTEFEEKPSNKIKQDNLKIESIFNDLKS
jgi:hypothetical protein